MAKEIKLCLLYRDMWQSSGKYMPRVDQLARVAGPIIDMGCFSRVETNGGGFEQINLLFGENPNQAVREWTQPFNDVGIQTQMLERGLNGIRMSPVSADIRKLMFKVKKAQGTDIARSFDGLNDARNLQNSITFAKEAGMVSQAALCITHSELHTVDYYIELAETLIGMGAEEIAVKDMAGVGRPVSLGKMIKGIKENHPEVLVQYHGHSGPGFSVASMLEAARAGAEYIDVAMEPLSWGTVHPDVITIVEMLKDAGFSVPDVDMKAYMEVRRLTQEFMDDFLGYYINPKNRLMNSLLIGPGLPGGMMGSLMSDLENNLKSLNKWKAKNGHPEISQDDLLIKLFDEVKHIWPDLGFPPLVTPFSQYVKNAALMNVIQMEKGKERWSMLDDNTWDMVLGKSGKVPGEISSELKALATEQKREFFDGIPQELYPDELDSWRAKMAEKGWETGPDDEELLEYAMHPAQYESYKSGKAKEAFEKDLAERKGAAQAPASTAKAAAAPAQASGADFSPKTLNVEVNGEKFVVSVSYGGDNGAGDPSPAQPQGQAPTTAKLPINGDFKEILAPVEGKFYLTKESSESAVKPGDSINVGDTIGYIESMKVMNAISATEAGKVVEVCHKDGDDVEEDDVLIKVG